MPSVLALLVPCARHDLEEPYHKNDNRPTFLEAAHDRVQLCADEFPQGQKLERNCRCKDNSRHLKFLLGLGDNK